MTWMKTLLWMMIFIFAILFSIQNKDEVTLQFGLYPIRSEQWMAISGVPLFLPILLSLFIGILIGGLGDIYGRFQLKRNLRQNQKTIERLEQEIHALRQLSLGQPFKEIP